MDETKTAINIANPSIHAVDLWAASAVETSIIIEITAATTKTLKVKSSNAIHNNSKNVLGSIYGFWFDP